MSHIRHTRYVGKPAPRVDALEKVLGTAKFLGDMKLPGMLYARALRSHLPHARIVHLDVSPALQVPGVKAVITSDDFIDHGHYGFPVKDDYMLAYEKVRYVGDAIAAVAAETPEAAVAGAKAIICELEPLPVVSDMEHALDADAPQVGPDREDGKHPNFLDASIVRKGDVDLTLKECDLVIERDYSVPHQEHAYLETEGALAIPTPEGGVIVYCSNQSPFINQGNLAMVLGLAPELVRSIQPPVGGSFGGKDDLNYETSAQCAALALKTGRPVRMTFSREESMVASYKRDAMRMSVTVGVSADGTLKACKFRGLLDSGAYASESSFTGWRASIHAMGAYRYEAVDVDITSVYTNNAFAGAFRGFGNPEVCFAIEQTVDEIAERLGQDPIDFRLKNALRLGDELPHGQKLDESVSLVACLQEVRKRSDWDRKRRQFAQHNVQSEIKRGIGVAALFHGLSLGAEGADYAGATIAINPDNSITLTSGFTDYGQGSRTVFTLVAAEILGVEPKRIDLLRPDTDTAIESGPTVASRATVLGGNATRLAAANLKKTLDLAAAEMLHCQVSQLVRDGEHYIGPDEHPVSWDEVVAHARSLGLQLSAQGRWEAPKIVWKHEEGRGSPYFAYHFAAQVAEVEVDTGTGEVHVVDIWAAHDLGRVIFPQGAYGQVYGGIAQGVGYALTERIDFVEGYLQQTNFERYLIPTALDVPPIHASLLEFPLSAGPFGAKNVAEPAMVPTAPAIANAIAHATGHRIRHLPATLERVLLGHDLPQPASPNPSQRGLWVR